MADGIESTAPGQLQAAQAVAASSGNRPRVGGRLGRHELLDVLGHGAMASVFRARDTHLGREVAIKVMNLVTASRADAAERFRREAHAVAALRHPAVVEIFDFVTATDEEPAYIVSELINGPTLRQFVEERGGRLFPEVAALLLLPLCDALGAAHARGIVHRDLKPDNVMLEHTGGRLRVVLTDFGVAHVAGLETMTATGALVGSPAYMAPEQARGHEAGKAADLWALGVMFYELVVGRVPFPGNNPIVVLSTIARGQYQRAGQIAAAVGARSERLIAKCLKLEQAERFADAQAIAAELRELLAEAGISDEAAALKRYLQDPAAFEAALRPQVSDAALTRAKQHARRGEIARALAEIGRATAYVPGHPGAERLLATLATRRRWLTMGGAVAGVALLVSGGIAGIRMVRGRRQDTPTPTVPVAPERAQAPMVPNPAPTPRVAEIAPAPSTPTTKPDPTAPQPAGERRETRPDDPPRRHTPRPRPDKGPAPPLATRIATDPATEPTTHEPTDSPTTPAAAPAPPPSAGPTTPPASQTNPIAPAASRSPAPSAAAGTVSLTLSARFGNCHPALDSNAPSAQVKQELLNVKPGRHAVYCSEDPLAEKALVGYIDIAEPPAGAAVHHRYRVDKPVDGKRKVERMPAERAP